MRTIKLPHDFIARPHQIPPFQALDSGVRNVLSIWHRRAGKDIAGINYIAKAAHQRIGVYWHMLPTLKQARTAIWEARDNDGKNIVDRAIPPDLVARKRNDDMMIEMKCGSVLRLMGADNFDTNVGANPVGVVMSEAALMSPLGMQYIRPILVSNNGWMWLNTTPRGKNYIYDLVSRNFNLRERKITNPDWFVDIQTILDTGLVTPAQVQAEIDAGLMTEARAAQEYYCSFDAADEGSIYGRQMEAAQNEARIGLFPYDPRYPVETAWDVGTRDATAIVFAQRVGSEIRVIDFYMNTRQFLPHYVKVIHERPYAYSRHIWPHDTDRDIWAAGTTALEIAHQHGLFPVLAPKLGVDDGIEAVRVTLPRMTFNITACSQLIEALKGYHRKWDETKRTFSEPVHTWHSDPADALRYLCVTPETYGTMPSWAADIMGNRFGGPRAWQGGATDVFRTLHPNQHSNPSPWSNSGQQSPMDYDPLGEWRGRTRH